MPRNKDELPRNWFKRFSRKKHRGREYYFNTITKERLWHHPLKDIAKGSVVEWLDQNETQSDGDNNLPVIYNSPPVDSQCDNNQSTNDLTTGFSAQLEAEYKKFEKALAIIEKETANQSTVDASSAYSPYECNKSSSIGSSDSNFDKQSIQSLTSADEQAIHEVSSLRRNKEPMLISRSFHLVIDTNIFLSEMTFLEFFLRRIDEVPGQPMLVIPYVVLQELDELKMRTKKITSVQAMIAIAFISHHLKMMPNHVCGQSAMDNGIQLIEIFNANDSIVNCCLQLKQSCEHVVLLTNDLSLSNKAICSHIEVCTRSEFEAIVFGFKKDL